MADFAQKHNIKKLFIGYGNLPAKTFFDPKGTDKESSIFLDPQILDRYEVEGDDYENWKKLYIDKKLQNLPIGQARKVTTKLKLQRFLQVLSCYFERAFGFISDYSYRFGKNNFTSVDVEYSDNIPSDYIFFPMQVSTDAQIILNYEKQSVIVGLIEAIQLAKKAGKKLVVKPHPAEINHVAIEAMNDLRNKHSFILTNQNTFKLIQNSAEVITINSTVGLEARIAEKKVTFLGDSIYKKMTDQQMKNYIMKYLIEIEYFSQEKIDEGTLNKVLKRA